MDTEGVGSSEPAAARRSEEAAAWRPHRQRVTELACEYLIDRNAFLRDTADRGLLLISPHFDSFLAGMPFIGLLFKAAGRSICGLQR